MSYLALDRWLRIGVLAVVLAVCGTRLAQADAPVPESEQGGSHWRLPTARGPVHVWTPASYDQATAITVVFVHGYNTDVDSAWRDYKLAEQFAHSGVNAMFIACGAPASLERGMVWMSLSSLLQTVSTSLELPLPAGQVVAVGHSAAYRTLVHWLGNTTLRSLVLLDAAYGEEDRFMAWARDDASHQLINVASDTIQESNWIHAFLPGTRRVYGLPETWDGDVPTARIVYIRTGVGHMPMITEGIAMPVALRAVKP